MFVAEGVVFSSENMTSFCLWEINMFWFWVGDNVTASCRDSKWGLVWEKQGCPRLFHNLPHEHQTGSLQRLLLPVNFLNYSSTSLTFPTFKPLTAPPQENSMPLHSAWTVQEQLKERDKQPKVSAWPPNSSDLSPTERPWDVLAQPWPTEVHPSRIRCQHPITTHHWWPPGPVFRPWRIRAFWGIKWNLEVGYSGCFWASTKHAKLSGFSCHVSLQGRSEWTFIYGWLFISGRLVMCPKHTHTSFLLTLASALPATRKFLNTRDSFTW